MPRRSQVLTTVGPMLPDCEMKLSLPAGGCMAAKPVACSLRLVGHQAHAVGTDESQAVLHGGPHDLPLLLGPFAACLGEAGGQHHGRPDPAPPALLQHALDLPPAHGQQNEVGRLGQVGQTG